MIAELDILADVIAANIRSVTAPLVADVHALRGQIAHWEARLADVETRAAVPGPAGRDGQAGTNGRDGVDGKDGQAGTNGRDGLPGLPGRDGADGAMGPVGPAGRDGTLEGVTVEPIDERTWRFVRADGTPLGIFRLDAPLYRGVWSLGRIYAHGDAVTYAGCLWITREATDTKPGVGSTSWQLAVKCGRDGKDGKPGPMGPTGLRGERGESGRDYR